MPNHDVYLKHFGTLGMKWGIRRYQNEDGTLTELGKLRYGSVAGFNRAMKQMNRNKRDVRSLTDKELNDENSRLEREKKHNALMKEVDPTAYQIFQRDVLPVGKKVANSAIKASERIASSYIKMCQDIYKESQKGGGANVTFKNYADEIKSRRQENIDESMRNLAKKNPTEWNLSSNVIEDIKNGQAIYRKGKIVTDEVIERYDLLNPKQQNPANEGGKKKKGNNSKNGNSSNQQSGSSSNQQSGNNSNGTRRTNFSGPASSSSSRHYRRS